MVSVLNVFCFLFNQENSTKLRLESLSYFCCNNLAQLLNLFGYLPQFAFLFIHRWRAQQCSIATNKTGSRKCIILKKNVIRNRRFRQNGGGYVISALHIRAKYCQKMLSFFVLIVIFGLAIAEKRQVESESLVPCILSLVSAHGFSFRAISKLILD